MTSVFGDFLLKKKTNEDVKGTDFNPFLPYFISDG